MRPRHVIALTVCLFATLSILVAVLTPPYESVDEPDHVQNVEALTRGHLYPLSSGHGIEAHQPPLYYAGLAAWQRVAGLAPFNPQPVKGCNFFAQQCKLLYNHHLPGDGNDQRRLALLRLPNVVLGILAILLTALAASKLSDDPWTPAVAAAIVAGVPRLVFLSGVVNNDNLSGTLAAALTALAIIALRAGSRLGRRVLTAIGVILGLLFLTKLTALVLAPGALLAVLLGSPDRGAAIRRLGLVAGAGVLAASPWLLHNLISHGDPLALSATHDFLTHQDVLPGHGSLIFVTQGPAEVLLSVMPRNFYRGLWYESGWTSFHWGWFTYLPFWLLTAAGLAGLLRRGRPPLPRGSSWVLGLLALLPVVFVYLFGLETNTSSARWALIGLPAFALLLARGLERWPMPVAFRFALPLLGLLACLASIRSDVVQASDLADAGAAERHHVARLSACYALRWDCLPS